MLKQIFIVPLILAMVAITPARAVDVFMEPDAFLSDVFGNTAPEPSFLWLKGDVKTEMQKILGRKPGGLRMRYWQDAERTVWILEEIGKTQPITTGISVKSGAIERVQVLIYRESHGWEVRYPFFTDQFRGMSLAEDERLSDQVDGISGATLSVRALTKLARLALRLDGLTAAAFVVLLSVTGLLLNHATSLNLDETKIENSWILDWYGIAGVDETARAFDVGNTVVSSAGGWLFFDEAPLVGGAADLVGGVAAGDLIVLALPRELILLTRDGELVERFLPVVFGADINAIGTSPERLYVKAGEALFSSDVDAAVWTSSEGPEQLISWSSSVAVPTELIPTMNGHLRGEGLPLYRIVLDLHSGNFFGELGVWIMDGSAILLLVLRLDETPAECHIRRVSHQESHVYPALRDGIQDLAMSFLAQFFTWWHSQTLATRFHTWRHGELMGEDAQGNKYYRSKEDRRWVVYNGLVEASRIPPEWHGWIHKTVDTVPADEEYTVREWQKPHQPNLTGTPYAYRPDGSLSTQGGRPRVTGDYDAWSPE
eukprot:s1_g1691.t1